MPVLTRSQASPGQSPGLVTSPRAENPRRVIDSRQGNAVVSNNINDVGSPSIVDANGNNNTASFSISKCLKNRCKTCLNFKSNKYFISNITKKQHEIINLTNENICCNSQNLVYLLCCNKCNIQYVGETTTPLNERINRHRTAKSGCEHVISHFEESCQGGAYDIYVLEKLPGNGYVNGKVCPEQRKKRLEKEDHWMKCLRTVYPYGLNERVKGSDETIPVGKLFPPLPRTGLRGVRTRINRNICVSAVSIVQFFESLETMLLSPKSCFNEIRKLLDKTKKRVLKEIATAMLHRDSPFLIHPDKEQMYQYILDIIDTKLYSCKPKKDKVTPKNICILKFPNKGIELIRLPSIINDKHVLELLPPSLQDAENNPVITFKLDNTIRNKVINYKDTVNSIFVDEDVSFATNTDACECAGSPFINKDHKHIITGDLRIIENKKLRKLLSKGPNYREPKSINFKHCLDSIKNAINDCIINLSNKYSLHESTFLAWKQTIIDKVQQKILTLKRKTRYRNIKPVLKDLAVSTYLEQLHRRFVIVPIDKASNNFAFICKSFYISKILNEVGINTISNPTYKVCNDSKDEIINNNTTFLQKFDLKITDQQKCLPIMYWIPKMHKNPVGCRFIIASKKCSTKPLTEVVSKIFKLLFSSVENFYKKSRFYSRLNKFWVVQNSFPVTEKLDKINVKKNAKCISTFDFSTLYTKIPHDLLLNVLGEIIDFVFKGNSRNKIGFSPKSIYWTKKGVGKHFFSKDSLKSAVHHLITKCYFNVGNIILLQTIGIPMGIDPAPFWANLFLHHYEVKYIQNLSQDQDSRCFKYHSTVRFIDDLCALNDSNEFASAYKDIYPPELELKVEHMGPHATFLDLDITIANNEFVYKLFDKRDNFNFYIVRMPHLSSNIPSTIFYGSILSEFLRIARSTLLFEDFLPKAYSLYERMIDQGGSKGSILKQISKGYDRHKKPFEKFNMSIADIMKQIIEYK